MNEILEFIGQHPWISFFILLCFGSIAKDVIKFIIVLVLIPVAFVAYLFDALIKKISK